ncbi:3-deoxy-D-manno-octulosonic-acid transferase [Gillisia mitskevichiae]|uniref:3-deoxy-D-manno-octulosonic acid transferase n=1 Tax=Gillisia mitskevichiae TaxID=270921 RepID=A0A495PZW6_9FLAO|nr:glycosyltransferase N-terminal domain-containing protein [Gillisia mitskevichiae]RKS56095.1 3-deoxy-D-manno-octulosonic-acid transferase [Gillisia mitskevichiae]
MKLFVEGRKNTFSLLRSQIHKEDRVIWFHMASLGEYEQGVPVMKRVKELFPKHKILVSFYSPSGYEIKKNSPLADLVIYLPLDTAKNAKLFLDYVHPELTIFVKYEFWPNILNELNRRNIQTVLISGGFREDQLFFKMNNNWFRKPLEAFDYFFVQNEKSKLLLNSIGFYNVKVSGDTRFDRVANQLQQNNKLEFIEEFIDGELCIVAGSTWTEDESFLKEFIVQNKLNVKIIIAPHSIDRDRIRSFQKAISSPSILYSEKDGKQLSDYDIMIIDTIGLLTKIYSYADIAYVGGAVGTTGLHNILEPATFGIPIITGPNLDKFPEAVKLKAVKGLYSVNSKFELINIFEKLIRDSEFRHKTGNISKQYIEHNVGATKLISAYLENNYVKMEEN